MFLKPRTLELVVKVTSAFLILGISITGLRAAPSEEDKAVALVTGANRGLGLEIARQLQGAGYLVIGTARDPDKAAELRSLGVQVEQLDVTKEASVTRMAKRLEGRRIDLLVNNAGIYPRMHELEKLDFRLMIEAFEVNAVGPLRVTKALLPNLRRGKEKKIVQITSRMGSIGSDVRGGRGSYAYRASKAALNSLNRTLSHELVDEGFICAVLHPGWVKTDLGGPNAPLTPDESVRGLLKLIANLQPENNGGFFDYQGNSLPW